MIVNADIGFELRQRIGAAEGRNSEVYLAHDPQLDAEIVVKKIDKTKFVDVAEYFAEATRLYDARHPNVVDVKYACQNDDYVFLAMPLYPKGSVQSLMDRRRLTNRQVVRYGLDMLHGLHHVHTRGMVHFDIKPSNVLIDATDKAALADFGISRHLRRDGLAEVDRLYIYHWPPEYLLANELPLATDVYQAGLTLYRFCSGPGVLENQARGKDRHELAELIASADFPDRSALPIHVPPRLKNVILKAIRVDPDDRFPTVLDMLSDLAAVERWLDWQWERDATNDASFWTTSRGGQRRRIVLTRRGNRWSVEAEKMNESTGSVRQQHSHSGDDLPWGDARRLVERGLQDLE